MRDLLAWLLLLALAAGAQAASIAVLGSAATDPGFADMLAGAQAAAGAQDDVFAVAGPGDPALARASAVLTANLTWSDLPVNSSVLVYVTGPTAGGSCDNHTVYMGGVANQHVEIALFYQRSFGPANGSAAAAHSTPYTDAVVAAYNDVYGLELQLEVAVLHTDAVEGRLRVECASRYDAAFDAVQLFPSVPEDRHRALPARVLAADGAELFATGDDIPARPFSPYLEADKWFGCSAASGKYLAYATEVSAPASVVSYLAAEAAGAVVDPFSYNSSSSAGGEIQGLDPAQYVGRVLEWVRYGFNRDAVTFRDATDTPAVAAELALRGYPAGDDVVVGEDVAFGFPTEAAVVATTSVPADFNNARYGLLPVTDADVLAWTAFFPAELGVRLLDGATWETLDELSYVGPPLSSAALNITVGLLHDPLSDTQQSMLAVELLALDLLNAAGGVLGRRLVPETANVSAARNVIGWALESPAPDSALLWALPEHPLEECDPSVVHVGANAGQVPVPALEWALVATGAARVLLVLEPSYYANGTAAALGSFCDLAGVEHSWVWYWDAPARAAVADDTLVVALVQDVARLPPDLEGLAMGELPRRNLNASQWWAATAYDEGADYSVSVLPANTFASDLRARLGSARVVDGLAATANDAVEALAATILRAGSDDPDDLRSTVAGTVVYGAQSYSTINSAWGASKYVMVWPELTFQSRAPASADPFADSLTLTCVEGEVQAVDKAQIALVEPEADINVLRAARLALQDVNDGGGVLGTPVALVSAAAADIAPKLYVGCLDSDCVRDTVALDSGLTLWYPGPVTTMDCQVDVFYFSPSPNMAIQTILEFAAHRAPFFVIDLSDDGVQGYVAALYIGSDDLAGAAWQGTSLEDAVAQAVAAMPDGGAIVAFTSDPAVFAYVPSASEWPVFAVGVFPDSVPAREADGHFLVSASFDTVMSPENLVFRLYDVGGLALETRDYVLRTFIATKMVKRVVEAAGSWEPDVVRNAMYKFSRMNTPGGVAAMDSDHHFELQMRIGQIRGGSVLPVVTTVNPMAPVPYFAAGLTELPADPKAASNAVCDHTDVPCSDEFWSYTVADVCADGRREVAYAWNANATCTGGEALPDDTTVACDYIELDSVQGVVIESVAGVALASVALALALVFRNRRHRLINHGQPAFLAAFGLGVALVAVGVLVALGEPSDHRCHSQWWFLVVGTALVFAPLIVKTRRIRRIFLASNQLKRRSTRVKRPWWAVYGPAIALVVAADLLMLAWTVLPNPPNVVTHDELDAAAGVQVPLRECDKSSPLYAVTGAYIVVLMLALGVSVVQVRHVQDSFAEHKELAAAAYNIFVLYLVLLPIFYFTSLPRMSKNFIVSMALLTTCISVAGCVLGAKLWKVHAGGGPVESGKREIALRPSLTSAAAVVDGDDVGLVKAGGMTKV